MALARSVLSKFSLFVVWLNPSSLNSKCSGSIDTHAPQPIHASSFTIIFSSYLLLIKLIISKLFKNENRKPLKS